MNLTSGAPTGALLSHETPQFFLKNAVVGYKQYRLEQCGNIYESHAEAVRWTRRGSRSRFREVGSGEIRNLGLVSVKALGCGIFTFENVRGFLAPLGLSAEKWACTRGGASASTWNSMIDGNSTGKNEHKYSESRSVPGGAGVRRASISKHTSDNGWQLKAVTSETYKSGPTAGVDDEAEILKRQQLFNKIAPMYDNLNDWLSLGQHRVWKRMAVSWSGAKAGDTVLDICCGSGDLSFLLALKVGGRGKVIGLDFAKEQLCIAAERQQDSIQTSAADIEWIQGDALSLPFNDSSFDAITMGYGLRNVANISQALAEIHRVLKPGKTASILDFNRSPSPVTNQVQGFMLDNVVVPVATYFGVQEEYAYLKSSIARFPPGAEQEQLAASEGFSKSVHYELAAGLMGVLVATK